MISVVIPLYNKESSVVRAVLSIANQIYKSYEVIIVNDGSIDRSVKLISEWLLIQSEEFKSKVRLIDQHNQGVSVARNTGILAAKYDYIAFLDADDYWEINHLDDLIALISNYKEVVDVFATGVKQILNGTYKYPNLGLYKDFVGIIDYFNVLLVSSSFINSSSVCISKKLLLNNLFPIGMKNFEDTLTWAKCASRKGCAYNSSRSSIQGLDDAEASLHVDFINFVKFREAFLKIDYNLIKLKSICKKFIILNLLGARLHMHYKDYMKQVINLKVHEGFCDITIYSIMISYIPKCALKLLRNMKKK